MWFRARAAPTDPVLPRRTWAPASPLPEPVRHGLVGCIKLGQTTVAKMLGGVLYMGIITRFQQPHYQVMYEGSDTEEHTGRELARILKLKVNEITDPRQFYYDWSGLSMADVPAGS